MWVPFVVPSACVDADGVCEVGDGGGGEKRDIARLRGVTEGVGSESACRDGGTGREGGQRHRLPQCDVADELDDRELIRVGVTLGDTRDGVAAIAVGAPASAAVPYLHRSAGGIAAILESPLGADDGV